MTNPSGGPRGAISRTCRVVLWLVPLLLACGAPAAAKEQLDLQAAVPFDSRIAVRSELPNGMRYWIRPHDKPRGSVSLILHVDAGSVHETRDQRGYAHFVEHMAFEGSKNFPPGTLVPFFSSLGLTFGQHQNAHTSYAHTAYQLHLPSYNEASFAKGVLFMSDVARAVTFESEEVEKEIPVILEEFRYRGGMEGRLWRQRAPLLFYGSLYALRQPIGDKEVVRDATSRRLRTYHETWYRPERTTLVVVGDIEPKAAEAVIRKTFGDWKKPKRKAPKVRIGPLTTKGVRVGVYSDPDLHSTRVTVTHKRRPLPWKTYGDLKRRLVESAAVRMMRARLEYLRRTHAALFSRGWIRQREVVPGLDMIECGASGKEGTWIGCLREVVHEIERVHRYGFEQEEFERVRDEFLAWYDNPGTETSSQIADELQRDLARLREPVGDDTWERVARQCLPHVTARDVTQAFRALFDLDNVSIAVSVSEKRAVQSMPTKPEVLEYFEEAREDKLRTWTERNARFKVDKVLAKDPEPGALASKKTDKELRVTSFFLKNGIRVNARPVKTPGRVYVRVSFLGGMIEETAANPGITDLTFTSLEGDGLATKSANPDTVTRYLATRQTGVAVSYDDAVIDYDLWAHKKDLDDGMRLLWLLLTEPAVHYNAYRESYQSCCSWRWYALRDPSDVVRDQLTYQLAGKDKRWLLPTWKDYQKIPEEAAQAWLERIVRTAPMEVGLAGDLDAKSAEALARRWFGSLPERPDRRKELTKLRRARSWSGPVRREEKVETNDPGAKVVLAWRGAARGDRATHAALYHVGNIVDARLFEDLREKQGLSYDVSARYVPDDVDGMGALMIYLTTDPKTAKKAAEVARKVVVKLAKEGPTKKEVETAAGQWRALLALGANRPSWWLDVLTRFSLDDREFKHVKQIYKALGTADEALARKTIKKVLTDKRFCQILAIPVPPKKDEDDK